MLLVAPPRPAAALFRPRSGRSSPSTAWRGPRSPPAWRPCWATAATPTASSRSWSCWRCGALRGRGAGGSAARGGLGGTHGPALPQAKEEEDVLCAARTCRRLFAALLRRGELFAGSLPAEEDALRGERGRPGRGRGRERSRERPRGRGVGASAPRLCLAGNYSAEEKYKIWMRHRYNDCVESLSELLGHDSFQVKVSCGTVAGMRVCGVAAVTARRGRWECCRAFLGLRRPSALLGNAVHVAFSPSSPCGPGHRRAPPGDGCL